MGGVQGTVRLSPEDKKRDLAKGRRLFREQEQ